jgi:hypothetical protein
MFLHILTTGKNPMGSKENNIDAPMGKVAAMTTLKTMSQGKTIKKRSATPRKAAIHGDVWKP